MAAFVPSPIVTINPPEQTFLSTCPVCQEKIDVTSLEPFTKLKCPFCGQMVRVRRRFDHFMIVRQIGEGGMSRVFEAEDETLGRRVALKILNRQYSRDAVRLEQFRQEALITASITHPNVIKLYSVGHDQGYFYLAMELVGGGSLEQRIRREDKLNEGDALRICHEVAEGLRAAQQQGLIHRDVKPANILFTESGTAKVVDFGLALFADRGPDPSVEIWATPYYVAPEKILHNKEDYRSDIFSLGATMYHALTGNPPHKVDSHSVEDLRRVKTKQIALGDSGLRFSARTEHVINHMLRFDPDARFANYDEVVEELRLADGLLNQGSIRRRLISRRARLIGTVAAAILLAFFVGWLLREGKDLSTSKKIATQLSKVAPDSLDGEGVTVDAGGRRKTVTERFLDARHRMLNEQAYSTARGIFKEIADSEDTRQPTQCWARFNEALCSLMLGDRKHAERSFHDLAVRGGEKDTVDAANGLSDFFVKIGKRMEKGLGLGDPQAKPDYDTQSESLLGFLAQGLAEWHFGDAEAASLAMEHFQLSLASYPKSTATSTNSSSEWVPLYGSIVDRYTRDIQYVRAALKPHKVDTLDDLQAALKEIKTALDSLEKSGAQKLRPGPYLANINQMQTGLKREIARIRSDMQAEQREKDEVLRKIDLTQFEEVTTLIPALIRDYNYSRAINLLTDLRFDTKDVRTALEGRLYLYTGARDFNSQLVADLTATPWEGTLIRRSGSPLTGTVSVSAGTASTTNPGLLPALQITVDGSTLSVPFESVTPECLVEIAQSFTARVTDSTDYYRRRELAAAFARAAGLTALSNTLAAQLMGENRPFRSRWMKLAEAGI